MIEWATRVMEALGAPGAGLLVALENVFPPIPSELILPLAGFAASRGDFGLVSAIVWTTVGSLVGALALYGIGAGLGRDRMRALAIRIPLLDPADLDQTEEWFDRHGAKSVFFGRMLPVFRSLVSIPAGLQRMPLVKFAVLTGGGSLVWNSLLVGAGFALGEEWERISGYSQIVEWVILGLILLALSRFVITRVRRRRRS